MEIIGLGFRPTEEELVDYYLRHRLLGDDPQVHVIPDIDLCQVEPWDVPMLLAESAVPFDLQEWVFFSPIDFKYSNSKRVNRTTKCGFWKPTGKDREIRSSESNTVIATKKTLVYYKGRVPHGEKLNWVIHEYHAVTFHQSQRTFVLCRLMKKPGGTTEGEGDALNCDEGESSRTMISGYENQSIAIGTSTGIGTTFQPMHQIDYNFSHHHHSSNSSFYDAHFRNESNIEQISNETPQEETKQQEEFLNSIFVHEDNYVNNEQTINTFYNTFIQSEPLRKVYSENSDVDAEAVSELGDNIMYIPNLDEYYSSKEFDSELSNVDVHEGDRKDILIVNQKKNQKNAENTSSRENLETRSHHQSSDNNRKVLYMETTSSSQSLFPQLLYLVNVVLGVFM